MWRPCFITPPPPRDGAPTCFDDLIYEVARGVNPRSAVTSCSGQLKVSHHSLNGGVMLTTLVVTPRFISAYANSILNSPLSSSAGGKSRVPGLKGSLLLHSSPFTNLTGNLS